MFIFIVYKTRIFTNLSVHHWCQTHLVSSRLLEQSFQSRQKHRCHHPCKHFRKTDLLERIRSRKLQSE